MKPAGTAVAPSYDYFPDNGCSIAPSCLNCPLPFCRYDDPAGYLSWQQKQRRAQIQAVLSKTPSRVKGQALVLELAAACGIGERQAWRFLAAAKVERLVTGLP